MPQQQIKGNTGPLGAGGSLDVYDVPGSAVVAPVSASATFDGTGAAGAFIPCLTFKTQTGAIIARCPAPEVAAGDTAEVSWFQSVGSNTAGFIHYGSNAGLDTQFLDVIVNDATAPGNVELLMYPNAAQFQVTSFNATDTGQLNVTPADIRMQINPSGDSVELSPGSGAVVRSFNRITLLCGLVVLPSLPGADPGVPGALWNNAGVINISP